LGINWVLKTIGSKRKANSYEAGNGQAINFLKKILVKKTQPMIATKYT